MNYLLLLSALIALAAIASSQTDPDLPGHISPTESLEAFSLFIPMDRTWQGAGLVDRYRPNNVSGGGSFNMRAYGLVNALLWADIPMKWIIKNGKQYDDFDFCARTWERYPRDEKTLGIASQYRCFRAGPFAIPPQYTAIAERVIERFTTPPQPVYNLSWYSDSNGKKIVDVTIIGNVSDPRIRIFRLAEAVNVSVRHTLLTRPFAAVLDSSSFFTVQAQNLLSAGFVPGQHWTVMTKEEANAINSSICITFATEPHFLVSQQANPYNNATLPNSFVRAVRSFVASGGNFLAQCGGLSTYEQCDNIKPDGRNERKCPPTKNASICPDAYFISDNGLYFPNGAPTSCPLNTANAPITPFQWERPQNAGNVRIQYADAPVAQFDGAWNFAAGEVEWFSLWKRNFSGTAYGGVDSNWHAGNGGHPIVEDVVYDYYNRPRNVPGVYYSAHSKLAAFRRAWGGNVFLLAGHSYGDVNGRRLFMNAVLHPSNRSRSCLVNVTVCDQGQIGCTTEERGFNIDPCAYSVPSSLAARLKNVTLNPALVQSVSDIVNSNSLSNPSEVLLDSTITTTCSSVINLTFINGTTRVDSVGWFTFNQTTDTIINREVVFPDTSSLSCLKPGNSILLGPFAPGTVFGLWVAVGGIYGANPTYYYALNSDGSVASNFVDFSVNGTNIIAFRSGSGRFNELQFLYSIEPRSCDPNTTVTYVNETCVNFDPNKYRDLWFKSSCVDHLPLNVGLEGCDAPVTLPAGWVVSPVDSDFNNVLASYGSNWPSGCYQGAAGSYQNCTARQPSYPTFVNGAGQVCMRVTCRDRVLLRSTTTDTKCNPGNYDRYCDLNANSSVFDANPILPTALFVNLVGEKPVNYTVNPGPLPTTVEIMFLIDVNNLASARVAKLYWRDYFLTAINRLNPALKVGFGFAWTDGTLRGGQGIYYDKDQFSQFPDPSCNVPPLPNSTAYPCNSTNIVAIMEQLARSSLVGWETNPAVPHHRIMVVFTLTRPQATEITSSFISAFADNSITPLFITTSGLATNNISFINRNITWGRMGTNLPSSYSDVSSVAPVPNWVVSFSTDVENVRGQNVMFIDSDPWGIIRRPNATSLPLLVTFQDRTFARSPVTSLYPLTSPGNGIYTRRVNFCGNLASSPSSAKSLYFADYWSLLNNYTNTTAFGACDCSQMNATNGQPITVGGLLSNRVSMMNLPSDNRGPSIRILGRVVRNTFITVARDPAYAVPETYLSVNEDTLVNVTVRSSGENLNRVYTQFMSAENSNFLTTFTMLDGTAISLPSNTSNSNAQSCPLRVPPNGFRVRGAKKYCKLADGSVPRGRPSNWGEATIFYRLCDGCNCAPGPVSRRGGAFIKLTFNCTTNSAPVGADFNITLIVSSTTAVNITPYLRDLDDQISELAIRFSQLPFQYGTMTTTTGGSLNESDFLVSNQVVRFSSGPYSLPSVVYYTIQDPYGGVSPLYKITFNIAKKYDTPILAINPSNLFTTPRETASDQRTLLVTYNAGEVLGLYYTSDSSFVPPSHIRYMNITGRSADLATFGANTKVLDTDPMPITYTSDKLKLTWSPSRFHLDNTNSTVYFYVISADNFRSNVISVTYTVTPNQAPVNRNVGSGSTILDEDTFANFTIRGTDADTYDADNLSIVIKSLPSRGTLFYNGVPVTVDTLLPTTDVVTVPGVSTDYRLSYVPRPNENGADQFTYIFSDPLGKQATTVDTIRLTINPVNDPPTSDDVFVTYKVGTPISFFLEGFDIDGPSMSMKLSNNISSLLGSLKDSTGSAATDGQNFTSSGPWKFTYNLPKGTTTTLADEIFTFTLSDGVDASVRSYTVTLSPLPNSPPVASNASLTTDEDTDILIPLNGYFFDKDGDLIFGANIESLPNPATGNLYLNGILVTQPGSIPADQDGVYKLVFRPNPDVSGVNASFQYSLVDDGNYFKSVPATITVYINPVNDPPTISIDQSSLVVQRGSSGTFTVTVNDIDSPTINVNGLNVIYPLDSSLISGSFSFNTDPASQLVGNFPSGSSFTVQWTPFANLTDLNGFGSFVLQAVDDSGLPALSTASASFKVAPNAVPLHDRVEIPEIFEDAPSAAVIKVFGTDPDLVHQNTLQVQIVTPPTQGSFEPVLTDFTSGAPSPNGTTWSFNYKPNSNFNGNDSFVVVYRDAAGGLSEPRTIIIPVTAVNDPPTSQNVTLLVRAGDSADFAFLGSDIDSADLFLNINTDVSTLAGWLMYKGVNVSTAQTFDETSPWDFTYQSAAANYTESFTFNINDGVLNSTTYYVNINVSGAAPPNTPPVATDANVSTPEDTALVINLDDLAFDLEQPSSTLIIKLLSIPDSGQIQAMDGGSLSVGALVPVASDFHNITFNPAKDFFGRLNFTFIIYDARGARSNIATVTIDVTPVNDPPVLSADKSSIDVDRNTFGTFNFTLIDVDSSNFTFDISALERLNLPLPSTLTVRQGDNANADVLTLSSTTPVAILQNTNPGSPVFVTLDWAPGLLLPDGSAGIFASTLVDNEGAAALPVSVRVAVTPNTPPISLNTNSSVVFGEDSGSHSIVVAGDDVDSYHRDHLRIKINDLPLLGSLTFANGSAVPVGVVIDISRSNAPGEATSYPFVYTPYQDVFGQDAFTIVFIDDLGAESAEDSVTITINPVNDPPTSEDVTIAVRIDDTAPLTIKAVDVDFGDSLTLNVSADIASVLANISFNGSLVSTSTAINGDAVGNIWPFNYQAPSTVGNYSFSFTVTDGKATSTVYNAKIIVYSDVPPNFPPTGRNMIVTTDEDNSLIINMTTWISDPDGDAISRVFFNSLVNSTLGRLVDVNGNTITSSITPAPDGSIVVRFVPFPDQNGQTSFTYSVTDRNSNLSEQYVVTINVRPVNDPPTITIAPTRLVLNRVQTGSFDFTISDVDSTVFTVRVVNVSVPTASTLVYGTSSTSIVSSGQSIFTGPLGTQSKYISWTPQLAIFDTAIGTFTLQVTDGEGATGVSEPTELRVTNNNPPFGTLPTDKVTIVEDSTGTEITIAASDPDLFHQQTLTLTLSALPKFGDLFLGTEKITSLLTLSNTSPAANSTTAVLRYVPGPNFSGDDAFAFIARDELGQESLPFSVFIEVTPLDDPPVSKNVVLTVTENYCLDSSCPFKLTNPITVQISAQDIEGDSTDLSFINLPVLEFGTLMFYDGDTDTFVPVTSNSYSAGKPWIFSFQPAPGRSSTGTEPFTSATFIVKNTLESAVYNLDIFVTPVNDPPTSNDLVITTDADVPVSFTLDRLDVDSPLDELRIVIVELPVSNQGVFTLATSESVESGDEFPSFDFVFTPTSGAYSKPSDNPLAVMKFRIVDGNGTGLSSRLYSASVIVRFVAINITYRNDTTVTIDEDTSILLAVDRDGIDWFGGNNEAQFRKVSVSIVDFQGNGTLLLCSRVGCDNVFSLPAEIPEGSKISFVPAPDENGENYAIITLLVTPNNGAPAITVKWTINVSPINDPPTIVPHFEVGKSITNYLDEDTFFVVRFDALDSDSPKESLIGNVITFLDNNVPHKLYLCDGGDGAVVYDDNRWQFLSVGFLQRLLLDGLCP